MKRILLLLMIVLLCITAAACGSKGTDLIGTWQADHVTLDGANLTVSELIALGEEDLSGFSIILKDGGKAYVSDGEDGEILDWVKTEDGNLILTNEDFAQSLTVADGMMSLEADDMQIYFKKVSDEQIIGENKKPAEAEESESADLEMEDEVSEPPVQINASTDKYTWYIKNYVGKNCASLGYSSIGGNRLDEYGAGYLALEFVTPDGSYVDIESDDDLQQYVVTAQSLAPNTELKYAFMKDSEGNEYDNLVLWQSYEEIVLCVKERGSEEETTQGLTEISPSARYIRHIRDYSGRNLANCGYYSLGGYLVDEYGAGYLKLVIVCEDGSFVDPEDTELMKDYVVTGQNIAPNTELEFEYMKDSDGKEYDNLIESQSIEEIELTVKKIH